MVNHGRRSNACSLCKARKVKCDETKPQCLRCQKYGRECPGVPPAKPSNFRWRYQTIDPDEASSSGQREPSSPAPLTVRRELPSPEETQALEFYFDNFVSDNFFLAYLAPLYHNCQRPSPLAHIITASAVDCFSRMQGTYELYSLHALRDYHDALKSLREALEKPQIARQNETVAAVLLLIAWESQVIHIDNETAADSHVGHNVGALSLLRTRGEPQFRYPISLGLFRQARNQIFMSVAFRPTGLHALYAPGFDWFGDRGCPEAEESQQNSKLVEAGWHIPMLRERCAQLTESSSDDGSTREAEARSLLRQAEVIGSRLDRWADSLPTAWTPTDTPYSVSDADMNDVAQAPAWPGLITTYPSLLVAMVYNNYHILRVLLAGARLQILEWLRMSSSEDSTDTITEETHWQFLHQEMLDKICASIPFQTGQYPADFAAAPHGAPIHPEPRARDHLGAYLAYFPLAVASRQAHVSFEQRMWIAEQMHLIEQVNGSGLSCNLYYDTPSSAPGSSSQGASSSRAPTWELPERAAARPA